MTTRLAKIRCIRHFCALALLCLGSVAWGSQLRGHVLFNGLPVPGATVTATQGGKKASTVSDEGGFYNFADLTDGTWKIEISMQGFTPLEQSVAVAPNAPVGDWELKLLPLDRLLAQTKVMQAKALQEAAAAPRPEAPKPSQTAAPEPQRSSEDTPQASNNGLLINGSVNNAATSQYTLSPAFGNQHNNGKGLYTGGAAVLLNNSAFNARPYSLSGQDTPKPTYSQITSVLTFGGPLNIPHLMPRGPNFFVAYQWTRDSNDTTVSGLVPTVAQRSSILPNIDPAALYLLSLYPLPNVTGDTSYNYQAPILTGTHQDAMQSRLDKTIGKKDQVYGTFAFESSRTNSANLFGFVDKTGVLGLNGTASWQHRFSSRLFLNLGFNFSRRRTETTPFFAYRNNVSGNAGITGNNQAPGNWGPPSLTFSSGITGLSDAQSAFNRRRTDGTSASLSWYRTHHNITVGGDFRRRESNYLSQQNPRGSLTFTGVASGISDFADFLEGKADNSSVAYGNADKYFRQSVYDAYARDDWRILPELTINAGVRWEYGAPITELFNRLVNLDVASGFSNVNAVVGTSPTGSLTGQRYPASLLRPDRLGIEPRIGLSWRPIPGSTVVVRAGYGVYDDTSVYESTALQMAQQAPLSTSLNLTYNKCGQSFATAFAAAQLSSSGCSSITPDSFGVDPNFRVGYAQVWNLAVQRDLPAALQLTATYLGIKGTRGVQQFLPNSYAIGAANPCPSCQSGYVYQTSNGNSTRESGSVQLRRRLRNGFTATLLYTYSKSIDDDAMLGGQGPVADGATSQSNATATIAQNWLNLRGERSLSTFDQRHLLNAQLQYTTGQGIGGGSLLAGWRGRVFKEWTALAQIVVGSGLPETPMYLATVNGTNFTGPLRPNLTSASIYAGTPGHALNIAAFANPTLGQFGNAGRDSITGPNQFTFNASLARVFRLTNRFNLDIRVDSTNILNHVVFTNWNTTLNPGSNPIAGAPLDPTVNPSFGAPADASPMRSLQLTTRVRF